ncbi:MAG TPA: transposase [Gelidibacter sp.]|uniref:transposase n=1 Tax=Gelidibacter sp. TaxID=2018083 RepID=UPI002CED646E|nr:transposase [Gelidibacter sp.]HXJ97841.1 transposase [Gelidibacter sp.]
MNNNKNKTPVGTNCRSSQSPQRHRRSIRLKGYDYSQAGLYFITICCQDRICRFGTIQNGEMILNAYGKIAHDEWLKLQGRFSNFKLDVFQIMPNHMHGIIALQTVGATLAVAPNDAIAPNDMVENNHAVMPNDMVENNHAVVPNHTVDTDDAVVDIGAGASPAPTATIPDIVGAYKSLVANGCLDIYKTKNETMGKLWQRNYYEHIIRNENAYQHIAQYIINNPKNWDNDKLK